MDLHHSGSDKIIFIETEEIYLTITKIKSDNNTVTNLDNISSVKVYTDKNYKIQILGEQRAKPSTTFNGFFKGAYNTAPLFFEQHSYNIVIESKNKNNMSFWHDNVNIRQAVQFIDHEHKILSGIIKFRNEIGFSDFIVKINGKEHLKIILEVYPTKIDYKNDYCEIYNDLTQELYNLAFDFLKTTYFSFQQVDKLNNSPTEFFSILRKVFNKLINSINVILYQPHHVLETIHEINKESKIKKIDQSCINWLTKHPNNVSINNGTINISKSLSVKKNITYDTKENRMVMFIVESIITKLKRIIDNYQNLGRNHDLELIKLINQMITTLNSYLDNDLFKQISKAELTFDISLVFSMAPGYRDIYKYYLMLLRGLSITGDVFNISVKDLSLLYEYWCFIKLNSIMRSRYQLLSQDLIKTQSNGLFVSLVKGKSSRVKYITNDNKEIVVLSYNPKTKNVPTVTQKPDNILTLEKKGSDIEYEYVFDAKYRINQSEEGSDYHDTIAPTPGPEVSDINTMHRYRDAIVSQHDLFPYQRNIFGAYILFPYKNEEEYQNHRFYKSIHDVNIGGLPFLPSATSLVSNLLDDLIRESPDAAFDRASLPIGIESKLALTDWEHRDVFVTSVHDKTQLDNILQNLSINIPIGYLREDNFPINYISLYQPKKAFNNDAGIEFYGKIKKYSIIKNNVTNQKYYHFIIDEWQKLKRPIEPYGYTNQKLFTNLFLLKHSYELSELYIKSEEEYRLYNELKRTSSSIKFNDIENTGFIFNGVYIDFNESDIVLYKDLQYKTKFSLKDYIKDKNKVFKLIQTKIQDINNDSK